MLTKLVYNMGATAFGHLQVITEECYPSDQRENTEQCFIMIFLVHGTDKILVILQHFITTLADMLPAKVGIKLLVFLSV